MATQEDSVAAVAQLVPFAPVTQANGVDEMLQPQAEGTTEGEAGASSADLHQPPQTEIERCWEIVKTNPDDFSTWEYLIKLAETAEGITQQSAPENIAQVRNVYDQFLAKFPLCFGYWKKYADIEDVLEGPPGAEKIYERGVVAIANSVDLWTNYCTYKIEHGSDDETIRGIFERGASCCGLDFLAHVFWNKYIEFEESREAYDRVLKILERIIRIPMHQYATFFDKYTQLSPTRPVTELVSPEQYQQFEAEAKATPAATTEGGENEQSEQQTEKTEEQIQNDIRARIYNINVEIYMKTQAETNKRWPFEHEIKRPYFHVKPMDDMQLTNWRRYLDFEESEDDEIRVQTLYERCLVACALYEEFWQRYARWMLSKNRVEDARKIYLRATSVFIPVIRPSLRLSFACFEEEHGRVDEARAVYQKVLENVLGHIETISKYANFERRQQPDDLSVALNILNEGLDSEAVDAKAKAFLAVQVAKLLWHGKKSVHEARQVFQEGSTKYLDSKYFWLNYVSFELAQNDDEAETNVNNVFELVRTKSTLPHDTIRDFSLRCLDFLMERGSSISAYNKIEVEVNGPVGARISSESKKRNADDDGLERPLKQMRVDGDSTAAAIPPTAAYPGQQAATQAPYYAQGQWATYAATGSTQQYPYAYPYAQPAATAPVAGQPPTTPTTAGWEF